MHPWNGIRPDMEDIVSFGRWLMERRHTLDLTRDELADTVGCAPITIAKIERDERRPSRQMAELLADALKVPEDDRHSVIRMARGTPLQDAIAPRTGESTTSGTVTDEESPLDFNAVLPVSVTSLVGREEDLAKIRALLWRAGVRLVTLTGPPGIGKTRLGLAVAAALRADFRDGVRWVPLAPVSDHRLVATSIAKALNVKEQAGHTIEDALKSHLRDKQLMLLIDNFEHLLPAAPLLSSLLAGSSALKIMVTSREVLRIYGEHEYLVPPLAVASSTEPRANIPAVALFVQRAQAASPDFTLTDRNAGAVAEICRQLDGLPLAIELAAVRVKMFSPESMLARLGSSMGSLDVLTGGPRDMPARQQTLRKAIAWSYNLLNDDEKRLFSRLSVFRGGRLAEAVATVCMPEITNAEEAVGRTLELLEALTDKSLVGSGPGIEGQPRFWMLQTIFAFAAANLEASGEADEMRGRHARYYVQWASEYSTQIYSAEADLIIKRFDQELDNIRTALKWLGEHNEHELELDLAASMARYWNMKGSFAEGMRWLDTALQNTANVTSSRRARGLYYMGGWLMMQDESAKALPYLEASLAVDRALGDKMAVANSLNVLGGSKGLLGLFEEAETYFAESLDLFRELDQPAQMATSYSNIAFNKISQQQYDEAINYCMEALKLHEQGHEYINKALATINLGLAYLHKGDLEAGLAKQEEALAVGRRFDSKRLIAISMTYLGLGEALQGHYLEAEGFYIEAAQTFEEIGHNFGVARCLAGLARVCMSRGQASEAARLCAAADAKYGSLLINLLPLERTLYDEVRRASLQELGARAFGMATSEGRALSVSDALRYTQRYI